MKVKLVLGIVCLALLCAVPGAQAAALLLNNGAPNSDWGAEMASYLPANNFTFGSLQTVTNVRFWAVAAVGDGDPDPGSYNGSIVWQIYNDSVGQPGSLLNSGTATPTPVSSHATVWGQSYQFDFSITPTILGSGAYWLALHNGPMTAQDWSNYYWETSGTSGVLSYAATAAEGGWGPWETYPHGDVSLAFQLYGNPVPLPGAVWLLGSGLLGLIGLRKKLRS